jgi:hypothetical protein
MKLLSKSAILLVLLAPPHTSLFAAETSTKEMQPSVTAPSPTAGSSKEKNEALATAISKAALFFAVSTGEKTMDNPFYGRGNKMGFAVDGVFSKELVLTRGATYIFDVDTNVQHDFYFSTVEQGWGSGTVTEGIIGQFIYKGRVSFTPSRNTPARVYYACRNHKYMGGLIHVIDKGETVALESANRKVNTPTASAAVPEKEIKQKIVYANMLVMGQAAKRIEVSDDVTAKSLLEKAKSGLSESEAALKAGNNSEALTIVKSALDNANSAIKMVPGNEEMIDHRAEYAQLLKSFRNYKDSYEQQYNRAKKKGDKSFDAQINPRTIQKMENDAVELSAKGNYAKANEILTKAQDMAIVALASVFEGEEVLYSKSFATPLEEFQYELSRYYTFEDLIPIAVDKKRPSEGAIKLINSYTGKGKKISIKAKEVAREGDHAMAVLGLQEATRQVKRALAIAGAR